MALTPLRGPTLPPTSSVHSISDKSEIAPIVAVLSRQLPLPQAQQFAGQTALVKVVKSGPGNQAELEIEGQQLAVKLQQGRTLTAGEMVTVSFALPEKKVQDTRTIIAPSSPLASTPEGAEEDAPSSVVNHLSGAARLIGLLEQVGKSQTTRVSTQVPSSMQQLSTQAQHETQQLNHTRFTGILAQHVSAAIENSGLFYESHLQQWATGQRSTDQLSKEPQSSFAQEQVITEQGIDSSAVNQSAKMINAQLATLDHSKISLTMQGLLGQPIEIEIEPDQNPQHNDQTDTEENRAWTANLKLDMAHLGLLKVRVRMIGSQCDVQILSNAQSKQAIDPHWNEFERAMNEHGLKLNHGQVTVHQGEEDV